MNECKEPNLRKYLENHDENKIISRSGKDNGIFLMA